MLDWLIQALDNFTTHFLRMNFSLSNFIVLGVFFMFGFYFGKLTKNMTFLKFLLFLFLGLYVYAFLHAAHFMLVSAFIAGMVANHGRLILPAFYWAYDLKDVVFALKNRKAFDDIRRREEELEERIRQFRQEQEQFRKEQAQKPKREKASTYKGQSEKPKQKKRGKKRQSKQQYRNKSDAEFRPKPSSFTDDLRTKHLRTLGLDSQQNYDPSQIKKAYRIMAKNTHPDVGGSQEAFIAVQKAYEWLRIDR